MAPPPGTTGAGRSESSRIPSLVKPITRGRIMGTWVTRLWYRSDESPVRLQPGLTMVSSSDLNEVLRQAQLEGIPTYVLPRGLANRESFFQGVRAGLPLDPPIVGSRSWDALSDSLWGGIDALESERVVIIWPDSAAMSAAPEDLEGALKVLADVAASLADPSATDGRPKEVSIYVEQAQADQRSG